MYLSWLSSKNNFIKNEAINEVILYISEAIAIHIFEEDIFKSLILRVKSLKFLKRFSKVF